MKTQPDGPTCYITTEMGDFTAKFSSAGLRELRFPSTGKRAESPGPVPQKWMELTRSAVLAVLRGEKIKELPPLDLSGTEFQLAVWKALQQIPCGQTLSYGQVAKKIGRPGAVRAVGGACGANPGPLLIPCHRVLASGQKLGGFSAGLDWKRRLLEIERVLFKTN